MASALAINDMFSFASIVLGFLTRPTKRTSTCHKYLDYLSRALSPPYFIVSVKLCVMWVRYEFWFGLCG